jgi:hypothetical protein
MSDGKPMDRLLFAGDGFVVPGNRARIDCAAAQFIVSCPIAGLACTQSGK